MKKQLITSTLLLSFALNIKAQTDVPGKISERMDDQRIQSESSFHQTVGPVQPKTTQAPAGEKNSISMTKEELAKRPDLIVRALIPAVMQGNASNVELLYPLYQQTTNQYQDPLLTKWAQAVLAKKTGRYPESIRLYREILAQHSDILMARFQLAIALFENNEHDAAEDQFQKVRSEPIPEELKTLTDQYLDAMANYDRWSFSGGLTYLNDPNINNAPKSGTTYGNWNAPESESAQGYGLNLNAGKKWSWGNGFYNELRLNGNGKYYWNNKKYNEASLRGSFGLGYQNARVTTVLLPFMEQTLYAGGSKSSETLKRFAKSGGATLETSYWLSPKWQVNSTYEYAEQRYTSRKHLNGNYHFVAGDLTYLAGAQQFWFVGLNFNRTATRDKDDSYIRRGISLGWIQEWSFGLSSRLALNYARKNYKAPMPIFNITQRNKEYGATASLWHRAIHYKGITPRLTYNFSRVRSNHAFYSYDKHRVFVEFSKRF